MDHVRKGTHDEDDRDSTHHARVDDVACVRATVGSKYRAASGLRAVGCRRERTDGFKLAPAARVLSQVDVAGLAVTIVEDAVGGRVKDRVDRGAKDGEREGRDGGVELEDGEDAVSMTIGFASTREVFESEEGRERTSWR